MLNPIKRVANLNEEKFGGGGYDRRLIRAGAIAGPGTEMLAHYQTRHARFECKQQT